MTSPPHGASVDHPRASIVIVNKDDERVADTLVQLSGLERGDAEVIVVDASSHRLDRVRDRFASVTWLAFEAPSGRRTIAEQRNVGLAASRGAVVVFLDANCVPEPGWLEHLLEPIEAGTEAIVAGRIASTEAGSIHDRASHQGGSAPSYLEECACMNVAFRRDVFSRVGAFDEALGYAEDFDFAWRARDAGLAIRYEPAAVVRHHFGDTSEDLPRAFRYGVGRVRLYRKHPARLPAARRARPVRGGVLPLRPVLAARPRVPRVRRSARLPACAQPRGPPGAHGHLPPRVRGRGAERGCRRARAAGAEAALSYRQAPERPRRRVSETVIRTYASTAR